MRSSWIIQVGPKLSDNCPYLQVKGKGRFERKRDLREREGHVKRLEEHLEVLEAGRGKEGLSAKAFGETVTANT